MAEEVIQMPNPVLFKSNEKKSSLEITAHSLNVSAGGFLTSRELLSFLNRNHVYR